MKKMTMLCIAMAMIVMFGTSSQAQTTYATVAWDSYTNLPDFSNVPYCTPCDSIKCIPPSTVTGIFWSPMVTQHGDTLVLPNGFDGGVTCFWNGGQKKFYLRSTNSPTLPLFSTTDTLCGIETKLLDLGNVNQYGFNNYSWTPGGATTQTITASTPGTYSGTVTNACGTVNRSIQIWKFNNSKPNLGPDITACQGTTVVLDPGNAYSNVVWPSGPPAATYSVTYSGSVVVTTTNISDGCVDRDTINVNFLTPPSQSIDLVTIDTENGNNRVTWNTTTLGNANSVKIYRETTTNTYVLVGVSPYITGTFTDTVNSRNQAWRYKIAIIDTCGNEGAKSALVQSIHSWVTANVGGGYTLQWTPYVAGSKTINAYNIYYGNTLGQLNYLTYVSGNVTVYSLTGFADSVYVVGADLGSKSASEDALSNWVSQSDITGINNYYQQPDITIRQNKEVITITSDAPIVSVTVYDILGQTILSSKESTVIIPTEGIFLVSVMTEKGKITKKIVVQ